jgi:hypothetical protein
MEPIDAVVWGVVLIVVIICFGVCCAYFNKDNHDCGVEK